MDESQATLVSTGAWGDELPWELYLSTERPPLELCSAVLCVAMHQGRIVLVRAARGWGMVGGHIEPGESIEEALVRELREEAGYEPESYEQFAYRKLLPVRPLPHQRQGEFYPHPIGYIVYFVANTRKAFTGPTEPDVFEAKAYTMDEVASLGSTDYEVIALAQRKKNIVPGIQ